MNTEPKKIQTLITAFILTGLSSIAYGQTAVPSSTTFGSDNDTLGGFTHTAIDNTDTFLTTATGSVQYRNQGSGTTDAGFIKEYDIDRTADSGKEYTVTGTFTLSDGYADDNNRLGLILFTDTTEILDRDTAGQIGIIWNTDDNSRGAGPTGSNARDDLNILAGYNNVDADGLNAPSVLRNQAIPFAQNIYQGTQVTMSATFWFTGTDININASMTDAGGITSTGTASVLASAYTGDYFGFASAYRARNYDGSPNADGSDRDNPLIQDYESFSVALIVIPEPHTLGLVLLSLSAGGIMMFRRRK